MKGICLIGVGVVAAGIFVGFVAYKVIKKNPKVVESIRKVAAEAGEAFAEGYESATAKITTA